MQRENYNYTATHIANYFIENLNYVDNIRVNKLSYISYGFVLAHLQKKLFKEIIQAWRFGPVIPTIYHDLKHYGSSQITEPTFIFSDINSTNKVIPRVDLHDKEVLEVLEEIKKIYGEMSASVLIERTHADRTPWHKTFKGGELNLEIEGNMIKEYYQKLIVRN